MLAPGQSIDKYVVEALVGEGGLARVYRVRHSTLGSAHALKLLAVRGGSVHRRLVREGRIQATLDHPHVVSVSDVIEHEGHPGLVMEYIEGLSLDRLLQATGALPIPAALSMSAQIFGAIAAAHARGVLHRDLKPANVMLEPVSGGARAAVTDFGIARLMADTHGDTLQGDFLGTPGYMAPEQVSDPTAVDERGDVYGLGALVYCMVCGRPPFLPRASLIDTLQAAERAEFPAVLSIRPDCPTEVARAIEAALAPKPEDRPESVVAFGERLFAGHPHLTRVVAGQAGVVDLQLPGVTPPPPNESLQPITSAPPTGSAAASTFGFTAVPETFDSDSFDRSGGAATAVPESFADAPPATPSGGGAPTAVPEHFDEPRPRAPAQLHAAPLADRTLDEPSGGSTSAESSGSSRWPWLAAAVVLLLIGGWQALSMSSPETASSPEPPARAAAPSPAVAAVSPPAADGSAAPVHIEPEVIEPDAPEKPVAPPSTDTEEPPPAPPPAAAAPPAPSPERAEGSERTADRANIPAPAKTAPAEPPPEAPAEPADGSAEPPEPEAAEPASTSPEPPNTTGSASPNADATASEAPEAPEAAPEPEMPNVQGTFAGKYDGRPLRLRIVTQSGDRITGEMDVLAGPAVWKTVPMSGRVGADGGIHLADPSTGWTLDGMVTSKGLSGSIEHPKLPKPMSVSASRR